MPAGVGGFISFHIRAERGYFTICTGKLFHIGVSRYFTWKSSDFSLYLNQRGGAWYGWIQTARSFNEFCCRCIEFVRQYQGTFFSHKSAWSSATSIGANIHEANYAQSKADFTSKLQIALKECYETEYWLELFVKSELIDREKAKKIYNDCGTIRRMLIASINTAKENNKWKLM